jgi:alanyl-tRNA synthetase
MRRIEALSGRGAEEHIRGAKGTLAEIARKLGVPREAVGSRVDSVLAELDSQRKKLQKLEQAIASGGPSDGLMDRAVSVDGVQVLATRVDAPSIESLRYFADSARKQIQSGVAVLASAVEGRPFFVSIVTRDLIERGVHAGDLLRRVATVTGGSGGGRPDMAQGGGKDSSKISEALDVVPGAVREMLEGGTQ